MEPFCLSSQDNDDWVSSIQLSSPTNLTPLPDDCPPTEPQSIKAEPQSMSVSIMVEQTILVKTESESIPMLSTEEEGTPMKTEAMPVPTETKEEIELSYEQQQVLDLVKQRRNVFFTGSAGTGKSMLLKRIIKYLRDIHGDRDRYAVTASTGIAGVNVGGSTLYSWTGIGLAKEPAEELVGKIWGISKRQRKKEAERKMKETEQRRLKGLPPLREDDERKPHGLAERWQIVDTLIIDESKLVLADLHRHLNSLTDSFA